MAGIIIAIIALKFLKAKAYVKYMVEKNKGLVAKQVYCQFTSLPTFGFSLGITL